MVDEESVEQGGLAGKILRVAWLSVLAGILVQVLLIAVDTIVGRPVGPIGVLVGAAGKIAWATLVCVGVAIGLGVPRSSMASSAVWGLLSAPVAFHAARFVQVGLLAALGQSQAAARTDLLLAVTLLKSFQYAGLAALLKAFDVRGETRYIVYLLGGLLHGAGFGGGIVIATAALSATLPPFEDLLSLGVNEFVFPAMCASVIWTSERASEVVGPSQNR